jgi:predicted signal transduction protein with EAL and GGDEF domain
VPVVLIRSFLSLLKQIFDHQLWSTVFGGKVIWAIISLAHSLKLKAVAEGVETSEQLDLLRDRDCDEMQGFYLSKPQSAVDCAPMLRDERCLHWETPASAPPPRASGANRISPGKRRLTASLICSLRAGI